MSTSRDLVWFRSNSTVHWTTTAIVADTLHAENITANATNVKSTFPVPVDIHNRLNGQIELVNVILTTTPGVALDVVFFSEAYVTTTTIDTNKYIGHESFVAGDFVAFANHASTMLHASASGLAIPYVDTAGLKQFHIGIIPGATNIPKDNIVIEWAWRPDRGEH